MCNIAIFVGCEEMDFQIIEVVVKRTIAFMRNGGL